MSHRKVFAEATVHEILARFGLLKALLVVLAGGLRGMLLRCLWPTGKKS